MPEDTIVLSVRGATKNFGGLTAVDQLDFDVREHQVMGLIGPNGSGKTTMINLISGALKLTSGSIMLRSSRISGLSARQINRCGVARTFQLVRPLPTLSVLENVLAGAVFGHKRRWGADAEDFARRILNDVGMDAAADTRVSSLTYIDQKRLELARALAGEPEILLLDEWLAGLNPTELQTGIALIERLRSEGRTVVLVEHVMDAIRSLCDACVVMNTGRKIAEGTPSEVLANQDVVRAYLGEDDA